MDGLLEKLLSERRSMEQALAHLRTMYQRNPRPELARTIELLQAEIELRNRPALALQGDAVQIARREPALI